MIEAAQNAQAAQPSPQPYQSPPARSWNGELTGSVVFCQAFFVRLSLGFR